MEYEHVRQKRNAHMLVVKFLGKPIYVYFPLKFRSLPVVVEKSDEILGWSALVW